MDSRKLTRAVYIFRLDHQLRQKKISEETTSYYWRLKISTWNPVKYPLYFWTPSLSITLPEGYEPRKLEVSTKDNTIVSIKQRGTTLGNIQIDMILSDIPKSISYIIDPDADSNAVHHFLHHVIQQEESSKYEEIGAAVFTFNEQEIIKVKKYLKQRLADHVHHIDQLDAKALTSQQQGSLENAPLRAPPLSTTSSSATSVIDGSEPKQLPKLVLKSGRGGYIAHIKHPESGNVSGGGGGEINRILPQSNNSTTTLTSASGNTSTVLLTSAPPPTASSSSNNKSHKKSREEKAHLSSSSSSHRDKSHKKKRSRTSESLDSTMTNHKSKSSSSRSGSKKEHHSISSTTTTTAAAATTAIRPDIANSFHASVLTDRFHQMFPEETKKASPNPSSSSSPQTIIPGLGGGFGVSGIGSGRPSPCLFTSHQISDTLSPAAGNVLLQQAPPSLPPSSSSAAAAIIRQLQPTEINSEKSNDLILPFANYGSPSSYVTQSPAQWVVGGGGVRDTLLHLPSAALSPLREEETTLDRCWMTSTPPITTTTTTVAPGGGVSEDECSPSPITTTTAAADDQQIQSMEVESSSLSLVKRTAMEQDIHKEEIVITPEGRELVVSRELREAVAERMLSSLISEEFQDAILTLFHYYGAYEESSENESIVSIRYLPAAGVIDLLQLFEDRGL